MTKIATFVSILFSAIVTFITILFSTVALVLIFFSAIGNAAPILVDKKTGKYLGNLSANPKDLSILQTQLTIQTAIRI